jgi:apolipoprotein N-acyltransferase
MIICFGVLLWLGAPRPLLSLFTAALSALVVFAVVTQLWLKVSIHTGAMAGATAAVAFYSLPLAGLLTLGLIAVGWSRLVLKRHTLPEVLTGCALAAMIIGVGMSFA